MQRIRGGWLDLNYGSFNWPIPDIHMYTYLLSTNMYSQVISADGSPPVYWFIVFRVSWRDVWESSFRRLLVDPSTTRRTHRRYAQGKDYYVFNKTNKQTNARFSGHRIGNIQCFIVEGELTSRTWVLGLLCCASAWVYCPSASRWALQVRLSWF